MAISIWDHRRRRLAHPKHRSIVVVDIVESSRWTNLAQAQARAAVNRMVRHALRASGIVWWKRYVEGAGDGMIVLVRADVSKVQLLDPMIPRLIKQLSDYNAVVDSAHRIRLRVALHAGEVIRATRGWVGADLNLACRLVNGQPAYTELARNPAADLAIVVSDVIHQGIIRHGYKDISPTGYKPVHIVLKEADLNAWLCTPTTNGAAP